MMELSNRVVLVGGGHAHLHVVSCAKEFFNSGLSLELIDPGKLWYSGMATGMLGGNYSAEEDSINLERLCEHYDVKLHKTKATGLNPKTQIITLEDGTQCHYDVVSLNVGSQTNTSLVSDPDGMAWTVKPIPQLLKLQSSLLESNRETLKVAIVGGGPTGCEIACNIDTLCNRYRKDCNMTVFQGASMLVPSYPEEASRQLEEYFKKRKITVIKNSKVTSVHRDKDRKSLVTESNEALDFDEIVLATGLVPSETVNTFSLGENGLVVDSTLKSQSHINIFGAGDCIMFLDRELPKVGVFGVRQAPILKENLLRSMQRKSLLEYHPQKEFLAILNLGNGDGLAVRGNFYWLGKLAYILKNFIDKRFMKMYQL